MDVPTFIVQFPEFNQTDAGIVGAALARASRWVDPTIWGTVADDGIAYLAAHFLSSSPFGSNTKLAPKTTGSTFGGTTYGQQFEELRMTVAGGFVGSV